MAFDSEDGETLTRFIVERAHIRSSDNTVRHNAFMPPRGGTLSVFWITGLRDGEVWDLGNTYVAPPRGKPLLGRADLNSLVAHGENLRVNVVPDPHPRHAEITGWVPDASRARLQAVKLADSAILRYPIS